jgi:hypothetical protein
MTKPNSYIKGGNIELKVATIDSNGEAFTPTLVRLSVRPPSGTVVTYSGGDLSAGTGYLYRLYTPTTSGYYTYEGWVQDEDGREGMDANGFYVSDRIVQ